MFSDVQEATLKPSWAEEQFRFFLSDSEDAASMQVCICSSPISYACEARSFTIHCGGPETCGDKRGRVGVLCCRACCALGEMNCAFG
jgi:hypothetical protein